MDSGIAYDVSRVIGITIDDILDAVAREQMMSMMFISGNTGMIRLAKRMNCRTAFESLQTDQRSFGMV